MNLPLTLGGYLKRCRLRAGLSEVDVAEQIATEPHWPEHEMVAWIKRIEADVDPITSTTIVALRRVYSVDRCSACWVVAAAVATVRAEIRAATL